MPSRIDRHVSVDCPYADAAMRLRRFFQSNGNDAGDSALLPLRFAVPIPGTTGELSVERTVLATMQMLPAREHAAVRYRIQWVPEHPGPFPLFSGELVAESEDAVSRFRLCLAGTYKAPLGAPGLVFDGIVGNRIAQRTASRLLAHVRDAIESDARNAAAARSATSAHPVVGATPAYVKNTSLGSSSS